MNHVIIGNSAAGVTAAETLRMLDDQAQITIISDEKEHAYSRCLLPDFLSGERDSKSLRIRDLNFYSQNRINTELGQKVVSVDHEQHQVVLEDGRRLQYDKLLVASGASPFIPPIPGLQTEDAFGLRTIDDANRILEAAKSSRNAVIVGGGFIGLEAAYALRSRGLDVTVVEMAPQILALQFDEKSAGILADDIRQAGVNLITGAGVKEIEGPAFPGKLRSAGKKVILSSGDSLQADLLIMAAGTSANVALVRDTGIKINRGIMVDSRMRTSLPDIFAAGDVVETLDVVSGSIGLTPIWPNAVVQGRYAAHNMAGNDKKYSGMIGLKNAVEFRAVPAIAMGASRGTEEEGYEVLTLDQPAYQLYKKLILRDNRLQGMILVGDIKQAGVLGALIRNKTDVSAYKNCLLQPSFSYADILRHSA
ncbi:MAG: NAD(P)/FAD-dependent oxidoreductase [Dethiobacter sp.]|jgi:NAD(P)H-nitrite reductase large subunit|nr:NAD(P)/FAD-dependent oxidoreductase [Dethiobacter sp.]